MDKNVLLIPGTGGCALADKDGNIGWPLELNVRSWFLSNAIGNFASPAEKAALWRRLSMEFQPGTLAPARTSLEAGNDVQPGLALNVIYSQFMECTHFPYDWRSDIRDSGRKLLEFLKANKPPDGGKWKIVTHSQGGFLPVVAAKLYAQEQRDNFAFSRLVSHMAVVACPFYGTLRAFDAIRYGEELAKDYSADFLNVVLTWPSIYQMLAHYEGCIYNADQKKTETFTLKDKAAWAPQHHAMIDRAIAFRDDFLVSPIFYVGNIKKKYLYGTAQRTWNKVVTSKGVSHLQGKSGEDIFESQHLQTMEMGDGLVPFVQTAKAMPSQMKGPNGLTTGYEPTLKHAFILNDRSIAGSVEFFLNDGVKHDL